MNSLSSVSRLRRTWIEGSRLISTGRFQETLSAMTFRQKSIVYGRTATDNQRSSPLHRAKSVFARCGGNYWETITLRSFSSSEEKQGETEGEKKLREVLSNNFPKATRIIVEDISGGCGSMYQIFIESAEFAGLPMVKQHILVNTALKKEIKEMHGLRIQTAVPKG